MRKQFLKKITAVILSICILGIAFYFPCQTVNAVNLPVIKTITYFASKGNEESNHYLLHHRTKISDLNISNKNIADGEIRNENGVWVLDLSLKKIGTTVVYYRRFDNDTNKTSSMEKLILVVKKYQSPVKSIKIGKTALTSEFTNSYHLSGKPLKGKIKVTEKNGWKLDKVWKFKIKSLTSLKDRVKKQAIALKGNMKLQKGYRLVLRFKKGNQTIGLMYDAK